MKRIFLIFITIATFAFSNQIFAMNNITDMETIVTIGDGQYTYAVYCDTMLVCFIKEDSLADANAWAKATYGPTAYAELHVGFTPSRPGDYGDLLP